MVGIAFRASLDYARVHLACARPPHPFGRPDRPFLAAKFWITGAPHVAHLFVGLLPCFAATFLWPSATRGQDQLRAGRAGVPQSQTFRKLQLTTQNGGLMAFLRLVSLVTVSASVLLVVL